MEKDMTNREVKEALEKAKSGDNTAWEKLYNQFEKYIHDRAWKRLKGLNMPDDRKKDAENELYQAGWQGFLSAIRNYNSEKGEFLTYATYYIDGKMSKEIKFIINSFEMIKQSEDIDDTDLTSGADRREPQYSVNDAPDRGKYSAERRVLQIMEILRLLTDEEHSLSKDELRRYLQIYRIAKYDNGTPIEAPNTFTSTVEELLSEVNPAEYSEQNEDKYRIKYEGYKENRLKAKLEKTDGKKASAVTNFSYVHLFGYEELDRLIQIICLSDMLSAEEKNRMVNKLVSTAGVYYNTPFLDGGRLKFSPTAVHGRFSGKIIKDKRQLSQNIKLIQQAIKSLCQIQFKFNCYTADHEMIPKSDYIHTLSPYHLAVYHDNYYCIGLKKGDKRIWHYRADLMTDIEFVTDNKGKTVPIDVCAFEGLPINNASWDPEKYMAEHLYMAYDEPRDIHIKIRNTDYTILHDWFGDHYEKTDTPCGDGYDIVKVKTSPSMIVHWAMQYAGDVEIMDEEIREKIRREIKKLQEKYK